MKLGVVMIAPLPGWPGIPHVHVGDFRRCERCGQNTTAPVHYSIDLLPVALEVWEAFDSDVTLERWEATDGEA